MTIVKKYPSRVLAIHCHTDRVYTIELESLEKPFKFKPGQFLHLALDKYDPSMQWPESRCFSMQSIPDCSIIKITYSVKGSFTSKMEKQLKPGFEITLKLPYGDLFTQPHNKENTVFIAGGTGITPFLSLFNYASFKEYSNPVLYAGFQNRSMNLYHEELKLACKINSQFKLIPVYQNEEGILNIEKILQVSNPNASFFISGPPIMIKTFKCYLIASGIAENQVKTDDWE